MDSPLDLVRQSGAVQAILGLPGLGTQASQQMKAQVADRAKTGLPAMGEGATPGNLVGVGSTLAGIFGTTR